MTDVHRSTLAEVIAANPAAARALDHLGLDYCCHGDRSLAQACAEAALDPEEVASQLAALPVGGDTGWASLDAMALADHILGTHHEYLHAELPLLDALTAKVVAVHGARHPELAEVRRLVAEIRADLQPHLLKEERVLFPAIASLVAGQRDFPFGSVANPIRMMHLEHDRAGELLEALRHVTDGYVVPADACASYRSLYERLAALEADTHLHVFKENHRLFPLALQLADR
jgi:regulator of cell morphogenesis and NO signaling